MSDHRTLNGIYPFKCSALPHNSNAATLRSSADELLSVSYIDAKFNILFTNFSDLKAKSIHGIYEEAPKLFINVHPRVGSASRVQLGIP